MKYFLIIISVLLLLSCDSSSSSEDSFTPSGKVSLLNSEGNPVSEGLEDIIVMIYNIVEIDADLLQVKTDYPFIGTEINQETFFDIRDEEPIKTINCNSEGQYSFSIAKGDYNICYYKEEYGYSLIYELEISSDSELFDVALQEVTDLAGSISNFTFESGKVYNITDDLVIPQNSNVIFETGAYIDVANNKKIFLMDDFNLSQVNNDNFVYINSIYNYQGVKAIFRGIECVNNPSYNISNVSIKNAATALSFNSVNSQINISESTIINSNIGISTVQADSLLLLKCNIINNSSIGVDLSVTNKCNKNIIFDNYEGIRNIETGCDISDNYFLSNHMGIRIGFYNSMKINHNVFSKNDFGVSMSGANPIIRNNNFFDDKIGIELNSRYVQQYYDYCNPVIENNNIISTNWQIDIRGTNDLFAQDNQSWAIDEDYYCSENYWGQEKKIKDNDYWMDEDGFYFLIESELNNLVTNSGINN